MSRLKRRLNLRARYVHRDLGSKLLGLLVFSRGEWCVQVLVSTKGGDNYTAGDALKLLTDLNLTQQVRQAGSRMLLTKSAFARCTASIPARKYSRKPWPERSADMCKEAGSQLTQRLPP